MPAWFAGSRTSDSGLIHQRQDVTTQRLQCRGDVQPHLFCIKGKGGTTGVQAHRGVPGAKCRQSDSHGHALSGAPALWQSLQVKDQWRLAVEAVLADRLLARAASLPTQQPPAALVLVDGAATFSPSPRHWSRLIDQVKATAPFDLALADWLAQVYIADSLEQALAQRSELAPGEIWVTSEGHRVSRTSVSFYGASSGDGRIEQKARLDAASALVASLEPELSRLTRQRESLSGQMSMYPPLVSHENSAS